MKLVIFDFDGTLTTKDSLAEFLKFSTNTGEYLKKMALFLPIYILYKVGIVRNDIAKQKLLKSFFYKMSEDEFKKKTEDFSKKLDSILRDDIYKKFLKHKRDGDEVVVVSASLKCWLQPWCDKEGVKLLATELKFRDKKVTGEFLTKNCYGKEKVDRVKKAYELKRYDKIISYGDSKGDEFIFAISDEYMKV
jgi:HAD superfamily hydrolase (TIGR01490 family)